MEEDIRLESFLVAIAIGLLDQSLDGVIQSFHGAVGVAMFEEGQDVAQVPLAHSGHFLDGLQSTADGPAIPLTEVALCLLDRVT